jgi:uncharacterized membrane protein YtjA (UPF0391 family)
MLKWALVFFIAALLASLLGFSFIATTAAGIARTLLFVSLLVFLVTTALGVIAGRKLL